MAERLEPYKVVCQGGLDTRLDVVTFNDGGATYLQNFEPGLNGGYRRINGFAKYIDTEVPGTDHILLSCIFNNSDIIAAREGTGGSAGQSIVYQWDGASWNQINSDTRNTSGGIYRFWRYAWSIQKIIFVDGVNQAATWDGTTWTLINGAGAPADPSYVTEYKNRIIYAGYSAAPGSITISAPDDENDFSGASGAIELVVGDTITGVRSFRDQVIIFCRNSIYQLAGDTSANFAIQPVSRNIGCPFPDTIQEVNGDIVYLSADGIRTVAATARIGDFELGNLSKKIQSLLAGLTTEHVTSVTIPSKSQYRVFYHDDSTAEASSFGVLGGLRIINPQNVTFASTIANDQVEWEWSLLKGIKPHTCDADRINLVETILHGGHDGFIYQQESGQTFNGSGIEGIYKTPDFDFKDVGKRKFIHRVTPYIRREGDATITLSVYYNYNATTRLQPAAYTLTGSGVAATYGEAVYDTAQYGTRPDVIQRQPVEGSGFTVSLQFSSDSVDDVSYSIEAFMLEGQMAGRR